MALSASSFEVFFPDAYLDFFSVFSVVTRLCKSEPVKSHCGLAAPSAHLSFMLLLSLTPRRLSQQSTDILSTVGYDSIIQHLNNGRKNCKEFEEFLKER